MKTKKQVLKETQTKGHENRKRFYILKQSNLNDRCIIKILHKYNNLSTEKFVEKMYFSGLLKKHVYDKIINFFARINANEFYYIYKTRIINSKYHNNVWKPLKSRT